MVLYFRGVKEVLKKRLKHFYQRQKLIKAQLQNGVGDVADYLLVIDYEATCQENNFNFPHEIIEFPIVLVCTKTQTIVSITPMLSHTSILDIL